MKRIIPALLLLVCACGSFTDLQRNETKGTVYGTVTNAQGTPVASARVNVVALQVASTGTQIGSCKGTVVDRTFTALTQTNGTYRMTINAGLRTDADLCLNVEVSGSSFQTVTRSGIPLALYVSPDSVRVDVQVN